MNFAVGIFQEVGEERLENESGHVGLEKFELSSHVSALDVFISPSQE